MILVCQISFRSLVELSSRSQNFHDLRASEVGLGPSITSKTSSACPMFDTFQGVPQSPLILLKSFKSSLPMLPHPKSPAFRYPPAGPVIPSGTPSWAGDSLLITGAWLPPWPLHIRDSWAMIYGVSDAGQPPCPNHSSATVR